MNKLTRILGIVLVLWLCFVAGVYVLMLKPPGQFAAAMAKMPGPAFMIFPFETMWTRARSGELRIGDRAPDFHLTSLDQKSEMALASFHGAKPVVLIFGSYT